MQVTAKPRMRGRLHEVAFFVSIPAGVALVALADTGKARFAAAVFAVGLAGVFGASAAYHRVDWSAPALRRMKRLDHSMIFILIAGTYTPLCLLALKGVWSVVMLATVWAGAITGIVLKQVNVDGMRRLSGFLYIALGWVSIIVLPQLFRNMSLTGSVLVVAGGLLYTLGAIVFASKRPDPNPAVFGYHEIWHAFTAGAGLCHYAAVLLLILAVR
ncbi:MAG: PAQR family membrane homeostasis protein TrhA [Actinomycetota bacterium]